jgi:hypothetical protein
VKVTLNIFTNRGTNQGDLLKSGGSSGLNLIFGGMRTESDGMENNNVFFIAKYDNAIYLTSNSNMSSCILFKLIADSPHTHRWYHAKCCGYSIRCVKDNVTTGVSSGSNSLVPIEFNLFQNYPNPFNPATTIKYNLQKPGNVVLKIYNLSGEEVQTLVNEFQAAGEHQVKWQPGEMPSRISSKSGYTSGVYFYQLKAGEYTQTKKMLLLK